VSEVWRLGGGGTSVAMHCIRSATDHAGLLLPFAGSLPLLPHLPAVRGGGRWKLTWGWSRDPAGFEELHSLREFGHFVLPVDVALLQRRAY
jgi:hypothetical protein